MNNIIKKASRLFFGSDQMPSGFSKVQYENLRLLNKEIKERSTILKSRPVTMSVILEGKGCNISCIYCTHWWGDKARGFAFGTPEHLIKDMRNYLPTLRLLSIGGGEPLVYSEWYDLLDMAGDYPYLKMSLTTNGMGLTEKLVQKMSERNFTWIRFSVDAARPETSKKIRVNSRLSKVLRSTEWIQKYRRPGQAKIQWNFVIMDWNYREVVHFVELAHKFGVDCVNFKMLIPSDLAGSKFKEIEAARGGDPTLTLFDLDISADYEKSRELLALLDEARIRAAEYGINMLDQQVLPYILKKIPDFDSRFAGDELNNSYVPDNFNIADRKSIVESYSDIERSIPPVRCNSKGTAYQKESQVLYLDEMVQKLFPQYEPLIRDNPVISLQEVLNHHLEQNTCLHGDKSCSTDEPNEVMKFLPQELDQIFPNFFCTLPFTNLSWGEYRFQGCCYAQPGFTYSNFSDKVNSLEDLWNSKSMQLMRKYIYEGKINRTCKRTCPHFVKGGVLSFLEPKTMNKIIVNKRMR